MKKTAARIGIFCIKVIFFLALCGVAFWLVIDLSLPDVSFLAGSNPRYSRYMLTDPYFENTGLEAAPVRFVPLSEISPHLIRAVLVSEDDLFFMHDGFNWDQFQKSLEKNLKKKKYVRGGSTITQQLARNLFLYKDKTIVRKLREWLLTFRLERELSKPRILELYLNFAEFGPGIYGVSAAALSYYKIEPKRLSAPQAAWLASVLPNPKYYGKKPHPAGSYVRQRKILAKMASYDLALPTDLFKQQAVAGPIKPVVKSTPEVMGVTAVPSGMADPRPKPLPDEPSVVSQWQDPTAPSTETVPTATLTSDSVATDTVNTAPTMSTDFFLDD